MSSPGDQLAWERLHWDSEFFGIPIGRADLRGATPVGLARLDDEARAAGVRCLYGHHHPDEPGLSGLVQEAGWMLLDIMSRFELRPHDPAYLDPTTCTVRRGTPDDIPALRATALSVAPWSRFAVDRRFGIEAAERLHLVSLERAAAGTSDTEHHVVLAEGPEGILAYLTRRRAPTPIIETIANVAPGSGAAHALIADARRWAGDETLSAGMVAARNVSCFRSFARFGFRVAEVRYQYHRWLD